MRLSCRSCLSCKQSALSTTCTLLFSWFWLQVARARNEIHSMERARLLGSLAEAGLPVLVVTGEHDHMVPPSAISRLGEKLGGGLMEPRLAMLPDVGHLSHEEAPDALVNTLATFLTGLRPAV